MSNLIDFAKTELALLRDPGTESDEMQDAIEANVLKMVEMFAEEGHSGSSAAYTIGILEKVLRFEPVTPLTGADDEWVTLDYSPDMAAQNKRCPHVFKRADGTAYDSNAVVFEDPDGSRCTNANSRRDITFPYRPKVEIVKRPAHLDGHEARELAASDRISAAQAAYDEALQGVDPSESDHEVRLFDAMKEAIAAADAFGASPSVTATGA